MRTEWVLICGEIEREGSRISTNYHLVVLLQAFRLSPHRLTCHSTWNAKCVRRDWQLQLRLREKDNLDNKIWHLFSYFAQKVMSHWQTLILFLIEVIGDIITIRFLQCFFKMLININIKLMINVLILDDKWIFNTK